MSEPLALDPKKSALLLMDFQRFVLDNFLSAPVAGGVVAAASQLLTAVRSAKMCVVHVAVGFRPGYPEVSPRNGIFSWLKGSGLVAPGGEGVEIEATLAPLDDEPVVSKHRIGAFHGTDLEQILRAQEIETLILAGITTTGVVLSTLRQAFDLDYQLVVARDGCADADREIHDMLFDKVFPHHARVAPAAEIAKALQAGGVTQNR